MILFRLTVIVASVVTIGCTDMCENDISQSLISPSGEYVAHLFSRNCGATTGYNSQVSVNYSTEQPPKNSGNVYISGVQKELEINWKGRTELEISGIGSDAPIKQVTNANGVHIIYVQ